MWGAEGQPAPDQPVMGDPWGSLGSGASQTAVSPGHKPGMVLRLGTALHCTALHCTALGPQKAWQRIGVALPNPLVRAEKAAPGGGRVRPRDYRSREGGRAPAANLPSRHKAPPSPTLRPSAASTQTRRHSMCIAQSPVYMESGHSFEQSYRLIYRNESSRLVVWPHGNNLAGAW
jgi:hypothetical protein